MISGSFSDFRHAVRQVRVGGMCPFYLRRSSRYSQSIPCQNLSTRKLNGYWFDMVKNRLIGENAQPLSVIWQGKTTKSKLCQNRDIPM
ncbi:hypothetical protein [Trichloromonas sp.]|uniref:hypothetical protein n=1 Tax=Trichloromonas sp. TaxID=3069249 RepID=UPI002A4711F0|nr:hypothetical protein [Trichloromonas sp.]